MFQYQKLKNGQELKITQRIFNDYNKLVILTREKYSYNIGKQLFSCDLQMFTDIVLFSKYNSKKINRRGIKLCLRNDAEKITASSERRNIYKTAKMVCADVQYIDTQWTGDVDIVRRKIKLIKI